jgi:hypothetical protein
VSLCVERTDVHRVVVRCGKRVSTLRRRHAEMVRIGT